MNFIEDFKIYGGPLGIPQIINGVTYVNSSPVAPLLEMTLAQLKAITDFSTIGGYVIRVIDRHDISGGGGSLFLADGVNNRAILISNPIHYTSIATLLSDFPLSNAWRGLPVTYQFTNGNLIELYNTGASGKYTNKYSEVIYNNVNGTVAAPTISFTGATSGSFALPVMEVEANTFKPGTQLLATLQVKKTGTGSTAIIALRLGTGNNSTDSPLVYIQIANLNPNTSTAMALINIVDNTHFTTNQSNVIGGTGSANAVEDRTTQFDLTAKMYLTASATSMNASDTVSILSSSLRLEKL